MKKIILSILVMVYFPMNSFAFKTKDEMAAIAVYEEEKDYPKALKLFQKLLLTSKYSNNIKVILGQMYEYGEGIQIDYVKAYEYYSTSNARVAKARLAFLYEHGLGVEQNLNKARELYHYEHKDNENYLRLAFWYANGMERK